MFVGGGVLIYLAIIKKYEPLLLIPIGFGTILANLPWPKWDPTATASLPDL